MSCAVNFLFLYRYLDIENIKLVAIIRLILLNYDSK